MKSIAVGVDVLVTSSMAEDGYTSVLNYIKPARTFAFIGSSGVGKSTLINRLSGREMLSTNGLRNDDKGRHTTTRRELILLENGGIVINTPGMRELGLESAALSRFFSDIEELSLQCRFRDCTHTSEPGCAILQAIEEGSLSASRFSSYQKLQREAQYESLGFRELEMKRAMKCSRRWED